MVTQKNQLCSLGCGMQLCIIPKTTFKTEYLLLTFRVPLSIDTAASYALLPSVLARGSVQYPTMQDFSLQLDTLYNAGIACSGAKLGESYLVTFQIRCLEQQCVPENENLLEQTIAVLCDLLFHPLLSETHAFLSSYVEQEKKNLIDSIRAEMNHKAGYAIKRLEREMCRGEKYSISARGTPQTVAAVTPEQLYGVYCDMLAYAPLDCFYVGKQSMHEVKALLSPLCSALEKHRKSPLYQTETEVIRQAAHDVRYVEEAQAVKQSRLCIGYRSASVLGDGDFYKFALFNELLGGSASSKLFLDVREARGLCYDCASFPEANKGLLYISCGIYANDLEEAKAAIDAQLEAIRQGDITENEFSVAKKSLISGYREIEDSASALAAWYANRLFSGITTSPAETAAQVETCTREDVIACAERVTEDTVYFMRGTLDTGEEDADGDDDGNGNEN